jgi:hypothetical protein
VALKAILSLLMNRKLVYSFTAEKGVQTRELKPEPTFDSVENALKFHPNTDLPQYNFLKYKAADHLTLQCKNAGGDVVFSKSWVPKYFPIAHDWGWSQDKARWIDNRS